MTTVLAEAGGGGGTEETKTRRRKVQNRRGGNISRGGEGEGEGEREGVIFVGEGGELVGMRTIVVSRRYPVLQR